MKLVLAFLVAMMALVPAAANCVDDPQGWMDPNGYPCRAYVMHNACEYIGHQIGTGGKTAKEACCVCGGGRRAVADVTPSSVEVAEDQGPMVFSVSITNPTYNSVEMNYTTLTVGNPTSPGFVPANGTIVTPPLSNQTVNISIDLIDNDIFDGSRAVYLEITPPDGGDPILVYGTILEDEPMPTVSIADATASESTGSIDFPVTLSKAAGIPITVGWAPVTNEKAQPVYVTIPPDQSSTTISIPISDDNEFEGNRTITVRLDSADFANIDPQARTATGTILEDDPMPTLSVTDAADIESGFYGVLWFSVRLSGPAAVDVTFSYRTLDGTATAGEDYTPTNGTRTITAGSQDFSIPVVLSFDTIYEGDETFFLELYNVTNAILGNAMATGTIENDDKLPTLIIKDATATEGDGQISFVVSLSEVSGLAVSFDFDTSDGSATSPTDYAATSLQQVTILAGSQAVRVNVTLGDDDNIYQGPREFTAKISNPTGATFEEVFVPKGDFLIPRNSKPLKGDNRPLSVKPRNFPTEVTATGTILDDEQQPTISIANAYAYESSGKMNFTVSLSHPSAKPVEFVCVDLLNRRELAGTIAPLDDSTFVSVDFTDDNEFEGNRTFTVKLQSADVPLDEQASTATGTIIEDDPMPTLSVVDASYFESGDIGGNIGFPVTLSDPAAVDVTFSYRTIDGTATEGEDYTPTNGTMTIPAGSQEQLLIFVRLSEDSIYEGDETFSLELYNVTNAILGNATATGTLRDDDPMPTLSIVDAFASEADGQISFEVSLSEVSGLAVTFDFDTADGSATSPADYAATTLQQVTIEAGTQRMFVNVSLAADDNLYKGTRFFTARIFNANGATLYSSTAWGTITENDPMPTISISDASAFEDEGQMNFTVSLSAVSGVDTYFLWSTCCGTATAGDDYVPVSRFIVGRNLKLVEEIVPAGDISTVVSVSLINDEVFEGINETFYVTLDAADGAELVKTANNATGTILEHPLTLSIWDTNATEDSGWMNFTVTLSQRSMQDVTFEWLVKSGTADFDDIGTHPQSPTILAGSTSTVISVQVLEDMLFERDETFEIEIRAPSQGTVERGTATGTILNDDPEPSSVPSAQPSSWPSSLPSAAPSMKPSVVASAAPSTMPSSKPSKAPSVVASAAPSTMPSSKPSKAPSVVASAAPSKMPLSEPSKAPSAAPSTAPCPGMVPIIRTYFFTFEGGIEAISNNDVEAAFRAAYDKLPKGACSPVLINLNVASRRSQRNLQGSKLPLLTEVSFGEHHAPHRQLQSTSEINVEVTSTQVTDAPLFESTTEQTDFVVAFNTEIQTTTGSSASVSSIVNSAVPSSAPSFAPSAANCCLTKAWGDFETRLRCPVENFSCLCPGPECCLVCRSTLLGGRMLEEGDEEEQMESESAAVSGEVCPSEDKCSTADGFPGFYLQQDQVVRKLLKGGRKVCATSCVEVETAGEMVAEGWSCGSCDKEEF